MSRRALLKRSGAAVLFAPLASIAGRAAAQTTGPHYTLEVTEVGGQPTYNGQSPGPTMIVYPGQALDVHLINSLPALHDDCALDRNAFHGLNTTNLHTHGLHVSPTTDSTGTFDADNVFVHVVPEGQFVSCDDICGEDGLKYLRRGEAHFRFEVGADHPSGTFWYHAHKHGATFRQVGAGLAGPLIIPDRAGTMPAYIATAPERIFIVLNRGVVLANPEGGGTLDPTLQLRPGAVERWRIINARSNVNSFVHFRTDAPDVEFHQIAFDGLTLPYRLRLDQADGGQPWTNPGALAPGNRTDIMVRVPPVAAAQIAQVSILEWLFGDGAETEAAEVSVEIAGEPTDALWTDDTTLPGPGLRPVGREALPTRQIDFSPGFTVDGAPYGGEVSQTLRLGDAEEWTVTNSTGGIHAYHIHVNPFFITHINGVELAEGDPLRRWQDTIGLPLQEGGVPGSVTFRTRFETFTGKFVIHCHVLRHEDLGMMQTVEVVG